MRSRHTTRPLARKHARVDTGRWPRRPFRNERIRCSVMARRCRSSLTMCWGGQHVAEAVEALFAVQGVPQGVEPRFVAGVAEVG